MASVSLQPEAIRGVLFDMDGLLLDTERTYRSAFLLACEELGSAIDAETLGAVWVRCIGTTDSRGRDILRAGLGPEFPLDAVLTRWREICANQFAKSVSPMPGAVELLRWLRAFRIPAGLVTSTARSIAGNKLRMAGVGEYFQIMLCGGEAHTGKPDPAPYSRGAMLLGHKPRHCLVLEDSENGVRSAVAAGAQVVQIPDLVTPSPEVLELGHSVHDSLTQTLELLTSSRQGS